MKKILFLILALVPLVFYKPLSILYTTVLGGLVAWFIGLFFGDVILAILQQMGVAGFSMWQIGLFLGFFGSFLGGRIRIFQEEGKKNFSPRPGGYNNRPQHNRNYNRRVN